jgi:hypothetical protein
MKEESFHLEKSYGNRCRKLKIMIIPRSEVRGPQVKKIHKIGSRVSLWR